MNIRCINENVIDRVFRAVGEATEEAILNSMVCAAAAPDLNGNIVHSLAEYLEKINR
jgi:D-aminopeptidase